MKFGYIKARLSPTALAGFNRNVAVHLTRSETYVCEIHSPYSAEVITWCGAALAIFKAAQFYYHKTVPT